MFLLEVHLGRFVGDALEEAAETAHGGEVEGIAGFAQAVVVDQYHRLGFLDDCLVDPCGGVLPAVACADVGEVFAGDAEGVGVEQHGAVLDGVLVEQGEESAIDVVLTGIAVALERQRVVFVYVDVLDHHGVEQASNVFSLVHVVGATEVALDVGVDAQHVLHLQGGYGCDEVLKGQARIAVGDSLKIWLVSLG